MSITHFKNTAHVALQTSSPVAVPLLTRGGAPRHAGGRDLSDLCRAH